MPWEINERVLCVRVRVFNVCSVASYTLLGKPWLGPLSKIDTQNDLGI